MANEDKRIIELPASESILNDDWIGKDSASQDTTKIQLSLLKQLFGGNNFAGEWHSGTTYSKDSYVTREGKLYHNITGSATSTTWKASQWLEVDVGSEIRKIIGSIAPTFDSSTNYDVGDLVTFNNGLCRCISPHSAGAWNSSHFADVNVSSLLTSFIMDNFTDRRWVKYSGSIVNYTKGTVIHKGLSMYRCKANTTNQSWDSSKWEQVDVTDLLATEHGYMQSLISSIAPTFSSSAQYGINDFVIYNYQLYICVKPHHGSWDSTDFTLIKIGDALEGIFNNIADVYSLSGSYVKGDVVNYVGIPLRCIVDTATSPMVVSEWEQVTVEQLIDEKVADVQIAGQTTTDENKISDLTSLAIEGTASGEIATFNDGSNLPMRSFICDIDAVQDLHGYDAPWVGGAGKNKFPILIGDDVWVGNQGATYTSSNGVLIIESLAPTNTSSGVYSSSNSKMRELLATLDGEYVYSFEIKCNKEASITCGISNHGNIARTVSTNWVRYEIPTTFSIGENVGCVFYNYSKTENLEIQVRNFMIQQGTTATPYEPYENICPISGHTGVDAWVRGKNLLPMTVESIKATNTAGTWSGNTYTYKGIVYTVLTDNNNNITGINADGTSTDISQFSIDFGGQIPVGNYYANGGVDGGSYDTYDVLFWDATTNARMTKWDGTTASVSLFNTTTSAEIRVPNITDTLRYRIRIRSGIKVEDITFYPMIRLATETDTTYEPYNPNSQTIQVSWQTEAGEVFGGYVDLVSGEMRVTDGYIDLGTCEWLRTDLGNNNYRYYTTEISNLIKVPSSTSEMPNIECSHYKNKLPSQYNQAVDGITIYTNGSIQVYDSTKSALTTTDFKAAMDGVQLVYELANPITYQLTPTQIKSLLGNNNAWCSTGDVNVKYNKDATIAYEDTGGDGSELITFGAGDGTTSRTFQLSRTPRKITMAYFEGNDDSGWASQYTLIWGVARAFGVGTGSPANTAGEAKSVGITYGADNKSFTVNASNVGSAMNTTSGHGYLMVEY